MKKENSNENNRDLCFSELGFPQDELVFEKTVKIKTLKNL